MKKGERVQVWDDKKSLLLGWGKITAVVTTAKNEKIPLIHLENGVWIWGNECFWISEKKANEVGIRIFQDIIKKA